MEGPLDVTAEDVLPFYRAYKYLYRLVNSGEHDYKHKLVAGDLISMNNRRVMHGREAFSNEVTGKRFLQGAYVEITEFQSMVQYLHNTMGDGRLATRSGSSSWD